MVKKETAPSIVPPLLVGERDLSHTATHTLENMNRTQVKYSEDLQRSQMVNLEIKMAYYKLNCDIDKLNDWVQFKLRLLCQLR